MDHEPYPLRTATEADLRHLSQALWSWHECPAASGPATTTDSHQDVTCGLDCPWGRHAKLAPFHALYRTLASSYVPDLDYGSSPALRSHKDLGDIIQLLKDCPDESRAQLMAQYFGSRRALDQADTPGAADQERAFSLAAWVMTGVACSGDDVETAALELGTEPAPWRGETSISQFLMIAFPLSSPLSVTSSAGLKISDDVKSRLSAETMIKAAHLRLQSTNDLRRHLSLDIKAGILLVYQQPSLLKEHLRAMKHLPTTATISEAIKVSV